MALPLCLNIPEVEPMKVTLPGAIELEDIDVLKMLQPALAPLAPVFNIIDTIVAVINCVKAIPDCLAPPNPQPLIQCLPELGEKLGKLLMLLPQLSVPKMIKSILKVVIRSLENIQGFLVRLQAQVKRILKTIDKAKRLNDAGLMAILVCAQGHSASTQFSVMGALNSIGRLFGILNIFLGMIGLPQIPDLSNLAGAPLDPLVALIQQLIDLLTTMGNSLPLP